MVTVNSTEKKIKRVSQLMGAIWGIKNYYL